jgi:hypothetical protein
LLFFSLFFFFSFSFLVEGEDAMDMGGFSLRVEVLGVKEREEEKGEKKGKVGI